MVIKYIGDASMHIHNASADDPEHPKTAVQCGLNMLNAVEKFNEKITPRRSPWVWVSINIGLANRRDGIHYPGYSYDVPGCCKHSG